MGLIPLGVTFSRLFWKFLREYLDQMKTPGEGGYVMFYSRYMINAFRTIWHGWGIGGRTRRWMLGLLEKQSVGRSSSRKEVLYCIPIYFWPFSVMVVS